MVLSSGLAPFLARQTPSLHTAPPSYSFPYFLLDVTVVVVVFVVVVVIVVVVVVVVLLLLLLFLL